MGKSAHDLMEIAAADTRYPLEAYEFLCHALAFTQEALDRRPDPGDDPTAEGMVAKHVSGQELLDGIRRVALEQFGQMAYIVFDRWGVKRTQDWGAMVYHLIEAGVWFQSPNDRREDFEDRYDFEQAFVRDFAFEPDDL